VTTKEKAERAQWLADFTGKPHLYMAAARRQAAIPDLSYCAHADPAGRWAAGYTYDELWRMYGGR